MSRLKVFLLLVVSACLVAGSYGALHNQISFTVGPDYFFHLKFQQFGLPDDINPRLGAALVGWEASWWMGLILGVPVGIAGFFILNVKTRVISFLASCLICVLTALAMGVGSLFFHWPSENFTLIHIPAAASDPEGYLRAAIMHSFSYLGGMIGGVFAVIATGYTVWRTRRL